MARGERPIDRGARRGRAILIELGNEILHARIERGLSQAFVAAEVGMSRNRFRQVERGQAQSIALYDLARILAVLGLDLSARAYPGGSPLRDSAHVALLARLRRRLPSTIAWAAEVPLPDDRDQRTWDAVISVGGIRIGIEAETRLRDLQSVLRRVELKLRDDPRTDRLVLLLADTRLNREALREATSVLAEAFPIPPTAAIQALSHGADPRGNSIMLL